MPSCEIDKRDALVQGVRPPPPPPVHVAAARAEEEEDEEWTCDECRAAPPPLRRVPVAGDELEAEVEEPEKDNGLPSWRPGCPTVWKRARVLALPRSASC